MMDPIVNASDTIEEELEALMNSPKGHKAQDAVEGIRPDGEAEVIDLDDLLAESTAAVVEAQQAKAARERLKRGGQSQVEKMEDLERVRAWEAAHEWLAVANCALFDRYECACGQSSVAFSGLLRRETHRHVKFSQRWMSVPNSLAALPNETVIRSIEVPLCSVCALGKGWDFSKSTNWEDRRTAILAQPPVSSLSDGKPWLERKLRIGDIPAEGE